MKDKTQPVPDGMRLSASALIKSNYPYLLAIVGFIFFKLLYPKPDLFMDSTNYIDWGLYELTLAFRPMGYTKFLMLFNGCNGNYLTIVIVQFIVFLVSSYFFLETLFMLFLPTRAIKYFCYAAVLFNPLCYYIINLISPDSLFISISALWLASLLRFCFFKKHRYGFIALHIVCFACLFYLRYNALYYPFFTAVILLFSRVQNKLKIAAIASSLIAFMVLYEAELQHSQEEVNVSIISGFRGWILANNAIHVYNVTAVDSNIFEDADDDELMLHRFVVFYKDSAYDYKKNHGKPTDQYMWGRRGPLKLYQAFDESRTGIVTHQQSWWQHSVLFANFGARVIQHYPMAFLRSFYLPNLLRFFYPNPEVLASYNVGHKKLGEAEMEYLGLHGDNILISRYAALQKGIVIAINIVYALLTPTCLLFCLAVILMYARQLIHSGFKTIDNAMSAAFFLSSFYIISMLLLVFAHPVLLRYIALLLIYLNILPFIAFQTFKRQMRIYRS